MTLTNLKKISDYVIDKGLRVKYIKLSNYGHFNPKLPFTIMINNKLTNEAKICTIAHEFGHYLNYVTDYSNHNTYECYGKFNLNIINKKIINNILTEEKRAILVGFRLLKKIFSRNKKILKKYRKINKKSLLLYVKR